MRGAPASSGAGYLDYQYFRHVYTAALPLWYAGNNAVALAWGVNAAIGANQLYAVPFLSPRGGTLDRISINLWSNAAVGNIRLGIYSNTSTTVIYPNALVVDAGAASTNALGAKDMVINVTLTGDVLYWLVCITDTATPTYRVCENAKGIPYLGVGTAFGTAPEWVAAAQAYGALPNPFPGGGTSSEAPMPVLAVRYSA